ncbi:MAG: PCRF domain-containing protein [Leptolyngbya sp. PLA3]|nr:MAG: PCRF domain-containing protein [Cyanobacteria bacterium CYA]MCE7967929.1 PCRF domain-containing protein [Leptolyngbya sp. PL-A3]
MPEGVLTDRVREKLDALSQQYAELGQRLEDPAVLADHRQVRDLSIRRAALAPVIDGYQQYCKLLAEAEDLRRTIASDEDADLVALARDELPAVEARAGHTIDAVKSALVSSDDRQVGSVILEVRAGTGGDEAGLWARDLLDVYRRYAAAKSWTFEDMEIIADPSVGGIRYAAINLRGEGVWQELAFEAGVHSVKRVPATETQGRIHTSTCTVAVLPEPTEVQVHIDWAKDVVEHVTTSQGPGGQNVNKVATAVHLVHTLTGVEVRMQETKSQAQNREKARRLLAARVYEIERQRAEAQRAAERKGQIGTGQRSEKIRTYRYQDNIVSDERIDEKFSKTQVIDRADLGPLFAALIEQQTAERLAAL